MPENFQLFPTASGLSCEFLNVPYAQGLNEGQECDLLKLAGEYSSNCSCVRRWHSSHKHTDYSRVATEPLCCPDWGDLTYRMHSVHIITILFRNNNNRLSNELVLKLLSNNLIFYRQIAPFFYTLDFPHQIEQLTFHIKSPDLLSFILLNVTYSVKMEIQSRCYDTLTH